LTFLHYIRETYHPLFHLRRLKPVRALQRWFDRPICVDLEGIGFPIDVSATRNLTYRIGRGRLVEEAERRNFRALVSINQLSHFWDVGANVGIYGFTFASLRPAGRTVLFEADPMNVALLHRTRARQASRDLLIRPLALARHCGSVLFYPDPITGHCGSIVAGPNGMGITNRYRDIGQSPVTVPASTLDAEAESLGSPDLIKIDVEGAEALVLEGGEKLLREASPILVFEASQDKPRIAAHLISLGYRLYDMASLKPIEALGHNNLALVPGRHGLPPA